MEFGESQRPTVDRDGESQDNPADVDHALIEKLCTMIGYESDEMTRGIARLWHDISTLLDFTRYEHEGARRRARGEVEFACRRGRS